MAVRAPVIPPVTSADLSLRQEHAWKSCLRCPARCSYAFVASRIDEHPARGREQPSFGISAPVRLISTSIGSEGDRNRRLRRGLGPVRQNDSAGFRGLGFHEFELSPFGDAGEERSAAAEKKRVNDQAELIEQALV